MARNTTELTEIAKEELVQALRIRGGSADREQKVVAGELHGRRPRELIKQLETKLLTFIQDNPGLRVEQINEKLGTTTNQVALPLKNLLAAASIRSVGHRRSTKYFAAETPRRRSVKKRSGK